MITIIQRQREHLTDCLDQQDWTEALMALKDLETLLVRVQEGS